jgi:hypothetical protein
MVPETVWLSLSFPEGQLTFTMIATAEVVATLDRVQYLVDGPREETLRAGHPRGNRVGDDDDEQRWQMFARATAAAGVASTLSSPINPRPATRRWRARFSTCSRRA